MTRRFLHIVLTLLVVSACNFHELSDPSNVSYVRVYLGDTKISNWNEGVFNPEFVKPDYKLPEIIRVGLFDKETGALVAERYLRNQGDDERGHYYDGYIVAAPGTYLLRAYNFGTESTLVGNEYNWYDMYAYTNVVSEAITTRFKGGTRVTDGSEAASQSRSPGEPIRWDADPLFVSNGMEVTVKFHAGLDTLRNADGSAWFVADNIVETYFLQVGVSGVQYISASAALLTGMASSVNLATMDFLSSEPTTLYLEMQSGSYPDGVYKGLNDYHCIYCTFGTFGRLPEEENLLQVSFEFLTTYGETYEVVLDVVPTFLNKEAQENNWLLIDKLITIPDPPTPEGGGGGLAPTVEDWGEVHSEIVI